MLHHELVFWNNFYKQYITIAISLRRVTIIIVIIYYIIVTNECNHKNKFNKKKKPLTNFRYYPTALNIILSSSAVIRYDIVAKRETVHKFSTESRYIKNDLTRCAKIMSIFEIFRSDLNFLCGLWVTYFNTP